MKINTLKTQILGALHTAYGLLIFCSQSVAGVSIPYGSLAHGIVSMSARSSSG